jgi:tRNA nucleotidyltransferase (CCA-adding enzyme)
LSQISLLQIAFPEIADLASEKFNIAMARLDAVAKASSSLKLRFATLGLVMEKASLFRWNNRMTLPADWLSAAVVAGNVMALLSLPDPENIVAAIQRLRRGSLSPAEFDSISQAAELNLPALSPLIAVMTLPAAEVVPDHLKGEAIGKWIIRKQTEAIAKAWEK